MLSPPLSLRRLGPQPPFPLREQVYGAIFPKLEMRPPPALESGGCCASSGFTQGTPWMRVIGRLEIQKFLDRHQELKQEISELFRDIERRSFTSMDDLRAQYPSIKVIDGRTVVLKVRGNRFRLSAKVVFSPQIMRIIALETHAQYDRRILK